MKTPMVVAVLALVAAFAVPGRAADFSGKWQAEFTTRNGQTRTTTFDFKVDGEKLTGTISGPRGDTPINDGKVTGDEISFDVVRNFRGNEFKMHYKGKMDGEQIKFTVEAGERSFEMTAKRASS